VIFNWLIERKIERLKQHIIRAIDAATIIQKPFPHLVVDEIFPDWYFGRAQQLQIQPQAAILQGNLGMMKIEDEDERFSYLNVDQRSFWRHLDAVVKPAACDALVKRFHSYTTEKLRLIFGQTGPAIDLADYKSTRGIIHFNLNETNRRIHLDKATSLFTYLLDFSNEPSFNAEGISLYETANVDALVEAYRKRSEVRVWYPDVDEFDIQLAKTIESRPNRLTAFVNLPYSLTGAIGRTPGVSIKSFCECPPQVQSLFSSWSDATTGGLYSGNL
jgi:hypothetical protein